MRILLAALCLFWGSTAWAQSLSLATFNVESDVDTQPELVATDLTRISPLHLWALQEVEDQATLDLFVSALNEATGFSYTGQLGTRGSEWGDHLAFIYLAEAFQDVSIVELEEVGGSRWPLLMTATNWSGQELAFVNVHFNRGNETVRQGQSRRLREWIEENQDLAIIALGDFNFDFDFRGARQGGNRAFSIFARGGVASWPQPICMANDNCPATGTQCNPRYQNMLDFVFLAGTAKQWNAISQLAFLEENYCRREADGYADHRPVLAQIALPAPSATDTGPAAAQR
ncbi:endonuclease/exonuclease/phosphatase family protein [Maricaulis sp.]|uniref:endonuclease/exonuclease/phosphatase family protein n=1 Tax=Maricaulis sp. TaxID=1486257 RepID=UPI002619BD07|nr:endonuclease/exonuclease/phosphatase family protein [Maricaulis sp.]